MLGVRTTARPLSEALLGQERSPQSPRQEVNFRLRPATEIKLEKNKFRTNSSPPISKLISIGSSFQNLTVHWVHWEAAVRCCYGLPLLVERKRQPEGPQCSDTEKQ